MDVAFNERFDFERPDQLQQEYRKGLKKGRVSIRGVKSLWVDCRFIPADQAAQTGVILGELCYLLFLNTFH